MSHRKLLPAGATGSPRNVDDHIAPRWVKVSGVIVAVVVVLIVVMMFTGHGPGRHLPTGAVGQGAGGNHATESGGP